LVRYIAARTRFFDQQTLDAIGRGVTQVVLVGAGYDGRALRFRSPGVRFFELDHPATQADKRALVERVGADATDVALVAADFVADDVGAALAAGGHDAAAASFILCEGVVAYLPLEVTGALLRSLRSRAATGSSLAVGFGLRGVDGTLSPGRAALDQRVARVGEPILTRLDRADAVALVEETGWEVVAAQDIAELDAEITPGRSLLVSGIAR
jgi:methyltransferase (TIGR00027 family)